MKMKAFFLLKKFFPSMQRFAEFYCHTGNL
jgi:hypothetical protein